MGNDILENAIRDRTQPERWLLLGIRPRTKLSPSASSGFKYLRYPLLEQTRQNCFYLLICIGMHAVTALLLVSFKKAENLSCKALKLLRSLLSLTSHGHRFRHGN
jgi:hypothetical protein